VEGGCSFAVDLLQELATEVFCIVLNIGFAEEKHQTRNSTFSCLSNFQFMSAAAPPVFDEAEWMLITEAVYRRSYKQVYEAAVAGALEFVDLLQQIGSPPPTVAHAEGCKALVCQLLALPPPAERPEESARAPVHGPARRDPVDVQAIDPRAVKIRGARQPWVEIRLGCSTCIMFNESRPPSVFPSFVVSWKHVEACFDLY
jgi:hypothetical protein